MDIQNPKRTQTKPSNEYEDLSLMSKIPPRLTRTRAKSEPESQLGAVQLLTQH